MFDLAWSELALIAVVAVVVIGPKDLPDAIRNIAKGIQKLRRMAAEFQGHADELVREAKLEDVRDQIRDIRNFDLKSTIEKNLDADGEIRKTFNDDPLRDAWKPGASGVSTDPVTPVTAPAQPVVPPTAAAATDAAAAFVPPEVVAAAPPPAAPALPPGPPAFIPPEVAALRPAPLAEAASPVVTTPASASPEASTTPAAVSPAATPVPGDKPLLPPVAAAAPAPQPAPALAEAAPAADKPATPTV